MARATDCSSRPCSWAASRPPECVETSKATKPATGRAKSRGARRLKHATSDPVVNSSCCASPLSSAIRLAALTRRRTSSMSMSATSLHRHAHVACSELLATARITNERPHCIPPIAVNHRAHLTIQDATDRTQRLDRTAWWGRHVEDVAERHETQPDIATTNGIPHHAGCRREEGDPHVRLSDHVSDERAAQPCFAVAKVVARPPRPDLVRVPDVTTLRVVTGRSIDEQSLDLVHRGVVAGNRRRRQEALAVERWQGHQQGVSPRRRCDMGQNVQAANLAPREITPASRLECALIGHLYRPDTSAGSAGYARRGRCFPGGRDPEGTTHPTTLGGQHHAASSRRTSVNVVRRFASQRACEVLSRESLVWCTRNPSHKF